MITLNVLYPCRFHQDSASSNGDVLQNNGNGDNVSAQLDAKAERRRAKAIKVIL
jgi:hypothetical protein